MSSASFLVLLLARGVWPDPSPRYDPRSVAVAQPLIVQAPFSNDAELERTTAVFRQRAFAKSFNRLMETLKDFADTYNQGGIDLKKAEAVKKAWRDLEKKEPWFRLENGK